MSKRKDLRDGGFVSTLIVRNLVEERKMRKEQEDEKKRVKP